MSGVKPRIRMIIPIWGDDYIERWLALSFAALRSDGNLPYLNEHSDFELALATKSDDAARLRRDPRFAKMTQGLRLTFVSIDELFPPSDEVSYGVPLALAYGKAIADLGERGHGSFVIIMTADMILSAGSLRSLLERIEAGYAIVTAPSIRVVDAEVRPLLTERVDRETGVMTMTSRQMMTIVNAHLHNTVRARTVNEAEFIDSTYYHNIYWRVTPDCLAAHYFLMMPLCFQVQQKMPKVLCPIDYGFITEICPDGRFTVLNDSDDLLMLELQERDSQSYLLRIAPPASTMEERLTRLEIEIATTTGGWATAEHRRSASRMLYFHERDLPPDTAERTARFAEFMQNIVAQMPPAPSHIRHFHWLGDVRNYRSRMARGDASEPVALLDDPRNSVRPTLDELSMPSRWAGGPARRLLRYVLEEAMLRSSRLRGLGRRAAARFARHRRGRRRTIFGVLYRIEHHVMGGRALRKAKHELAGLLTARLETVPGEVTVACVNGIENHLPALPHARLVRLSAPRPLPADGDFRLAPELAPEPTTETGTTSGTLVVFAPADLVARWDRLGADAERALTRFDRLIVILVQPNFAAAGMRDCSWMLSVMVGAFAPGSFAIRIDAIALNAGTDLAGRLMRLGFPSLWMRLPGMLMRRFGALLRRGLSYPISSADPGLERFSVLLIELTHRRVDPPAGA